MPTFVCQNNPGLKDHLSFSKDDQHHLLNVLRYKKQDCFFVTDNQGLIASVQIESTKPFQVKILKTKKAQKPFLNMALPLIEKKRLEWAIEKLTELNVASLQLITTERTQGSKFSDKAFEKLIKISESAQRQCGRAFPLLIQKPIALFDIDFSKHPLVFAALPTSKTSSQKADLKKSNPLIILGPEGGFSPEEIAKFEKFDFAPLNLGETILRTETACLAATSQLQFLAAQTIENT